LQGAQVIGDRWQGSLGDRRFRLLFIGQTCSAAGNALVPVALAFAVLDGGGGPGALGLVLAASRLPLGAFTILGGVVGDRLPRQAVMLGSDCARAVVQAVTAALLATGRGSIVAIALLQAAHSTAAAFFNPAAAGLTPQTVAPENLQEANALLGLSRSSTAIGGQIAAGVLVAAFGSASVFAIDAATYLISAASLALLRPRRAATPHAVSSVRRDLVDGWRAFRSQKWIAAGSIHIALMNAFVLAPFFVLGPIVSSRWLGGAAAWGAVAGGFAVGMVLGGTLALRVHAERPLVLAFAAVLLSIPQFVSLAVHAPVAIVVIAAVLGGGQSSFFTALWTTTLQTHVPKATISRVAALSSVSMLALAPLAYALVGPATAIAGIPDVLLFGAGWTLISTTVVLSLASVRRLTWAPQPPTSHQHETAIAT
jgi:hypothetical protein